MNNIYYLKNCNGLLQVISVFVVIGLFSMVLQAVEVAMNSSISLAKLLNWKSD